MSKPVDSALRCGSAHAWPPEVKERARQIWSSALGARSPARTEWLMMQEAKAQDPEGYVIDRVPGASTIRDWVRTEGWREQANALLVATLDDEQTDHDVQLYYVRMQGVETLALCQAGAYDHDPKLLQSKLKEVEAAFRVSGTGTYGNQFGSRATLPLARLTDGHEDEEVLSPQDEQRRLRERMLQEKQGGGS